MCPRLCKATSGPYAGSGQLFLIGRGPNGPLAQVKTPETEMCPPEFRLCLYAQNIREEFAFIVLTIIINILIVTRCLLVVRSVLTACSEANGRFRKTPVGYRTGGQQHVENRTRPLHKFGVRRSPGRHFGVHFGECEAIKTDMMRRQEARGGGGRDGTGPGCFFRRRLCLQFHP